MEMNATDARATWESLLRAGPNRQRKFGDHPLRLHFGTDHLSRPMLLLRVDDRPEMIRLGDAVAVEIGHRAVQKEWALMLTLLETDLTETFIDLCVDLADRSAPGSDESSSLRLFYRALEEFRDLLSGGPKRPLSMEEQRGLVAELWFALRVLGPRLQAADALVAWSGPLGSPQDFNFPDGSLAEVKSIHGGSRTITISSPEQLDPVDDIPLTLVTVSMEECPSSIPGSVTIPTLIEEFQASLRPNVERMEQLDRRLSALGIARTYTSLNTSFIIGSLRSYSVTGKFPRIRRHDVANGIDGLKYEISLRAITPFECPTGFTLTETPK